MKHNQFTLLGEKRFMPLFITQFLGAFHDNLFKNALVVLLLYGIGMERPENPEVLVTMATGLFILPFVLFSALGGQLADKFDKRKVIKAVKLAEIGIAVLGGTALLAGSVQLSFMALFALGAQSALFGPSKYSILPQHLKTGELIGGNALLNTGTFLAILTGTIAGTVLVAAENGIWIVSALLLICAAIGYAASRFIPFAPPKAQTLKLDFNPVTETIAILRQTFSQGKKVVVAVLGVAWFYFLGGMFMAQLPNYTSGTLHADEHVLAFLLVIFSIGIALGGLLNNRLLKGKIEARLVPPAILGITLFSTDLYFSGGAARAITDDPLTLSAFINDPAHWRVIIDLALISICGGLFVVPLNTIIQHFTDSKIRARIVAGSAIMNALFVVGSSVFSIALLLAGLEIRELFLTFAGLNALVGIYLYKRLNQ